MSAELLNPPTPSFDHLGKPHWWTCPKCAVAILVYPALPVGHVCAAYNPNHAPRTFYYYYVLTDDHRVHSLHLVDADEADPHLRVESQVNGQIVKWKSKSIDGELVFFPPTEEASRDHYLRYDDRIQRHEELPRHLHHRAALRGRHSA